MIDKNTIKALGLMTLRVDEVSRIMGPSRMTIYNYDENNNHVLTEKVDSVKINLELEITKADYDRIFGGKE